MAFCLCSSSVSGTLPMPAETAFGAVCLLGRKGVLGGRGWLGTLLGALWFPREQLGDLPCTWWVSLWDVPVSQAACCQQAQLCNERWPAVQTALERHGNWGAEPATATVSVVARLGKGIHGQLMIAVPGSVQHPGPVWRPGSEWFLLVRNWKRSKGQPGPAGGGPVPTTAQRAPCFISGALNDHGRRPTQAARADGAVLWEYRRAHSPVRLFLLPELYRDFHRSRGRLLSGSIRALQLLGYCCSLRLIFESIYGR